MAIVGWIILGLIAGVIAWGLHGRDEPGGVFGTIAAGIVGAVVGGLVAAAVGVGAVGSFFDPGTWLIAIAGAVLVQVIYATLLGSRPRTTDRMR